MRARADMAETGEANRKSFLEGAPGFAVQLRENVARGESFAGKPLTEEERAAYLSVRRPGRELREGRPGIEPVPPTIGIEQAMTIQRGSRYIEIRYLGAGHSRRPGGVDPRRARAHRGGSRRASVPLVGTTSFPASYAQALAKLVALKPRVILPGHGELLWKDDVDRVAHAGVDRHAGERGGAGAARRWSRHARA